MNALLEHLSPALAYTLLGVAVTAVVAGDFLAQRTGRSLGTRLHAGHLGRRVPGVARRRAESLMTRHGGRAVFLARFLPVVRTLVPHVAGATSLLTLGGPLVALLVLTGVGVALVRRRRRDSARQDGSVRRRSA